MANLKPHPGAPAPSNGVLTGAAPPGNPSVNRKKAKRRAKLAAKQQQQQQDDQQPPNPSLRNGNVPHAQRAVHNGHVPQPDPQHALGYDDDLDDTEHFDAGDNEDLYYTDDDVTTYAYHYDGAPTANGHPADAALSNKAKKKKKKKRSMPSEAQTQPYDIPSGSSSGMLAHAGAHPPPPPPPPPLSNPAFRSMRSSTSRDRIWNTSTQEERERIREFWLSLGEEERKSLVKIEKEAVLRKMKEQQKHSCSCTVCGRKRTAIEEELEVLYDAYYEELELYDDQDKIPDNADSVLTTGRPYSRRQDPRLPPDRMIDPNQPYDSGNRVEEIGDEEDEEDELEEEEYSDEDEEDYSDEEEPEELPVRGTAADFSFFGNSLTVKAGGILTVADDLLKNDGKKFIEMMEQLAERRMQREDQVVEHAGSLAYSSSMQNHHAGHNHGPPPDDEEYDDEDEDYDSQEDEYEEEEDDLDTMTEQQRMREGRRMFQIFAARMFEQRVLSAYREKVANERQQKLIEELDEENRRTAEREAKKTKDALKKKEKKAAQKQRQAEEKARKEAEKKAEEEAARAAETERQEELRKKREEQKKKRDAERRAQEEEKKRKDAEKKRRLEDERQKQQEADRKAQEQKAAEKKARDDAKRREREEREAIEREAREQKAHAEQQRKEKETRIKVEKEANERARKEEEAARAAQTNKRPSQPTPALPPGLLSKQSSAGFPSPHVQVATPNIPKAPTPSKPRQSSHQGSHGSSPKTPQVFPGTSKSVSPSHQQPRTILQKPQPQVQTSTLQHPQPSSPMPPLGPPPGMHSGFGGLPIGLGAPSPMQGGIMHGLNQPRGPMFPHAPPPIGAQYPGFPAPNGLPAPPPGMNAPGMPLGRGFPGMSMPPGFGQPLPGMSAAGQIPGFSAPRDIMPSHSRQASGSGSFDSSVGGLPTHPIARPTPIQRPSSVKPQELTVENKRSGNSDLDELSNHLGSSALLDDSDEPIPTSAGEVRRSSLAPSARSGRMAFGTSPLFTDVGARGIDPFGMPSGGSSTWGTPTVPFGPPGMGGSTWGSPPANVGWPSAVGSFSGVGAPLGASHRQSISRPVSVRLMVCQACKQLAQSHPKADGFYDITTVIRTIEAGVRGATDAPVQEHEVIDICETEGDLHNGGGFLRKKDSPDGAVEVKFEPDTATSTGGIRIPGQGALHGLGEIGSPVPSHSTPFGMGPGATPAGVARTSPFSASVLGGGVSSPSF
ncbi:stress response protein nst1 [Diplodia corticola]|uniref:Stress response protein NST1 n=1 Tax=Diplodia corticola TaxID=236234 RepID=A0A1J9RHA5_9PEZI|nr:stress response protein nst1 [Diplodia corticola]OJD39793.1 stress response protein nst1 [Diplodia corticola]